MGGLLPAAANAQRDHLKPPSAVPDSAGTRFGYATDPSTGEPLYAYKPSLASAPWQFRLGPDALEWRLGARADRLAYGRIRRLRLSFRPAGIGSRRYIAEIWPASGPKLTIASMSLKGIAERNGSMRATRRLSPSSTGASALPARAPRSSAAWRRCFIGRRSR